MKIKQRGGFSYIEVIIALALFIIVMAAVLPVLNQAALNARFAREGYGAHLYARHIMLRVRDALNADTTPQWEAGGLRYTVWVYAPTGAVTITASPDAPTGAVQFPEAGPFSGRTIIKVVIWNEQDYPIGRAVGIQ